MLYFCLYCDMWSCKCSCMESMSVSSCRCCMFVSCVHHVAVLNAELCMTCSLLMLVEDAMQEATIWKRHTHDVLFMNHSAPSATPTHTISSTAPTMRHTVPLDLWTDPAGVMET